MAPISIKQLPLSLPRFQILYKLPQVLNSPFLEKDGTVWACGHNGFGQFGNGTISSKISQYKFLGFLELNKYLLESGIRFCNRTREVYSSGRNNYGQLGDGSTLDKKSATLISSLTEIIQAEAGGIHSVFIKMMDPSGLVD